MLLFSLAGRIRPLPYAAASLAVFFSQHLVVLLVFRNQGRSLGLQGHLSSDWGFYVAPLRRLVTLDHPPTLVLILALAAMLIAAWALAALAIRRAIDANVNGWIAAFVVAPVVQIPAILLLCVLPSRPDAHSVPADRLSPASADWAATAQGVVAGLGLTLVAVATSTLVFRVYGFGLFVLSPFVIGAMAAYFLNRRHDVGASRTARLVAVAAALGGLALLVAALEGLLCIVLASPLGLGAAMLGGALGRAIALRTAGSARQTVSAFVLLPLVFALENIWSTTTYFETSETITVRAPAAAAWNAILHMDRIDEVPALPFRLGVAYPVAGHVIGEGVGAMRRGEFSTGTAHERVTEWIPLRKLAFAVLSDVPSMHELSPYEHVHAPHAIGYFRTLDTSFELVPRSDGGTDVIEHTSHELRLDPIFYWLPLARWMVHQNNSRVLTHIRRQAERNAGLVD
jgi:uncharacterized membrane protein YhaH (DUF805 family)